VGGVLAVGEGPGEEGVAQVWRGVARDADVPPLASADLCCGKWRRRRRDEVRRCVS